MAIEPDHIYLIPPSKQLLMDDGKLCLSELERPPGTHLAIDLFFRSLGEAHRERAVAIVLSGTGSDGSQGLRRIKEGGGVTLVQSPADAEHDVMPLNAMATGVADFVLPAGEMADKLVELWRNAQQIELPDPPDELRVRAPSRRRASGTPRWRPSRTCWRCCCDRPGTISGATSAPRCCAASSAACRSAASRRCRPTCAICSAPRGGAPAAAGHADQRDQFFPRPRSLRCARRRALGTILAAERDAARPAARLGGRLRDRRGGLFAGHRAARAIARRERPGDGAGLRDRCRRARDRDRARRRLCRFDRADVAPQRLQQFFHRESDHYRIGKAVRERVTFSVHNVLRDPPFSRMDVVCCRNLLIYLDRDAQRQVLETFHYALMPGGMLMLGGSETAEVADDLFVAIDKKNRLYRACRRRRARQRLMSTVARELQSLTIDRSSILPRARQAAGRHPPAAARRICAAQRAGRWRHTTILHRGAGTARFLLHRNGVSVPIVDAVLPPLRGPLQRCVAAGAGDRPPRARRSGCGSTGESAPPTSTWSCGRMQHPQAGPHWMLVVFIEAEAVLVHSSADMRERALLPPSRRRDGTSTSALLASITRQRDLGRGSCAPPTRNCSR